MTLRQSHFADARGYLYCSECGEVWRTLNIQEQPADLDASHAPPSNFAADYLDATPRFNPNESSNPKRFRKLARVHFNAAAKATGTNQRTQQRTAGRLYDADALCSALDLAPALRDAVLFHVRFLNTRANMRSLCTQRFPDGRLRSVRAEAVTAAIVALVLERFQAEVVNFALPDMLLEHYTFRDGSVLTPEEYRVAYHACAEWFGSHLWRDGPEDSLSENTTNR